MRVAENCHRLSREVMESPYPCRYSKAAWTWSCAPGSRWPCLSRRIGPDDLQRCLPLSTTLWFCDKCSQGCSPTSSVYMIFKYFDLLHFLHVCEVNCTGPANPAQFPHSTSLTLYSLKETNFSFSISSPGAGQWAWFLNVKNCLISQGSLSHVPQAQTCFSNMMHSPWSSSTIRDMLIPFLHCVQTPLGTKPVQKDPEKLQSLTCLIFFVGSIYF